MCRSSDSRGEQCKAPETLVFGLPEPILEAIAGEPIASFRVTVDHQVRGFQGYNADKLIPTFAYETKSGRRCVTALMVKWLKDPANREPLHYFWLAKHRAPIPRVYGTLTEPDGRVMLFLEYLEPIGGVGDYERFLKDPGNLREFLGLIARFNAIRPSPEYASKLPRMDVKRRLRSSKEALTRIWELARAGTLADELLEFCSGSANLLPRLLRLAARLNRPISKMPLGLIHSDLYPDNTAWRRATGELVAIDIEHVCLGPAFYDAALYLGTPEDIEPLCLPRLELCDVYLEQYLRSGGRRATADEVLGQTRILWAARTLGMLRWKLGRALDGMVDFTADREQGRRHFRNELLVDLMGLANEA